MKKSKSELRYQRRRAIARREGILRRLGGEAEVMAWEHGAQGRLAKGKIHCSCPLCRRKSYDTLSCRDRRDAERAKTQMCADVTPDATASAEEADS